MFRRHETRNLPQMWHRRFARIKGHDRRAAKRTEAPWKLLRHRHGLVGFEIAQDGISVRIWGPQDVAGTGEAWNGSGSICSIVIANDDKLGLRVEWSIKIPDILDRRLCPAMVPRASNRGGRVENAGRILQPIEELHAGELHADDRVIPAAIISDSRASTGTT